MKIQLFLLFFLSFFFGCSKDSEVIKPSSPEDLSLYTRNEGVMMQGFYWDVEPRHEWWKNVESKLENWKKIGIDRIWLPPVSKGMSGGYSMGYDPMDYFDLGEYDQMGTVKTRFGSRQELDQLINKAHQLKIEVIADIVLNHNSGGEQEFNPFRNKNTYTLFKPKSGRFFRNYNDFHPNHFHKNDAEAMFFEEQDLCHDQENVQKWLWKSDSSVAKYYKNTVKFDGWRFDYVKGFDPSVVKSWMEAVGGFGVLEVWDGNTDYLKSWVDKTGIKAFDFALFYNLEQALDGSNLSILNERNSLSKVYPDKSVTFVNNHDTEKETNRSNRIDSPENRLLAYAYILTHPGYPCIFYSDYESLLSKNKIEKLIEINRSLAVGDLKVLLADNSNYIAQRGGDSKVPGLILTLNNGFLSSTKSVVTSWKNTILYDYSGNSKEQITTDKNGAVSFKTNAKSYGVWAPMEFKK